jgi:periplasmic protein TonB
MTKNNEIKTTGKAESFDELVFIGRNKEYGAYYLRKKYNKYMMIAFMVGFFVVVSAVVTPLVYSYYNKNKLKKALEKNISAELENVNTDEPPPPPPPPPPPAAIEQQIKFTAPVVVDSVKEDVEIATMGDIASTISNEAPPSEIVVEEKKDKVVEEVEQVFVVVEENATFMGGDLESFRAWILEHLKYPESAAEMGIEGKVILSFVINSKGTVENTKVLRGVDPALDQEAIRVIQSSPKWVPGKQGGKAVKQQFTIPIAFKLQK